MKKISLFMVFAIIAVSLFAQTDGKTAGQSMSEDFQALQTANNLAAYGYAARSASALICAAEILSSVHTQPLNVTAQVEGTQVGTTNIDTPDFTPANLLADARRFAGNDRTMTTWATEVERALSSSTRGAAGGPQFARNTLNGGQSLTYNITFRGMEFAQVFVSGNGSSDLDLYVYDSNGRLVASDDDWTDQCYVCFFPLTRGTYSVKIVNYGNRANRFELYTD